MSLITKITDVDVTVFLSFPPQYLFTVQGEIADGSHTQAVISPIVYINPPADKLQEYHVHAIGVASASPGKPVYVAASIGILFLPEWAVGAKFVSETNEVIKHLGPNGALDIDWLGSLEETKTLLSDQPVPWPWASKPAINSLTATANDSSTLRDELNISLRGRILRDVAYNEAATKDIVPGRVTLWRGADNKIASVGVDPDREGASRIDIGRINQILVGRDLRVIASGNVTNPVIVPGRVTIFLTEESRVFSVSIDA